MKDVPLQPMRDSAAEIVSIALTDLRAGFEPKVQKLRAEAQAALEWELQRIDGYYASLVETFRKSADGSTAAGRSAYEARHVPAPDGGGATPSHTCRGAPSATDRVGSSRSAGRMGDHDRRPSADGQLVAERWLNGEGTWSITCPTCSAEILRIFLSRSPATSPAAYAPPPAAYATTSSLVTRRLHFVTSTNLPPAAITRGRAAHAVNATARRTKQRARTAATVPVRHACRPVPCVRGQCVRRMPRARRTPRHDARADCALDCACQCAGGNEPVGRDGRSCNAPAARRVSVNRIRRFAPSTVACTAQSTCAEPTARGD